jgi:outer membrane protein assembly factor BamB
VRRVLLIAAAALVVAGCAGSGSKHALKRIDPRRSTATAAVRKKSVPPGPAQTSLHLPPIASGPLPGYMLIADRDNNRALIVSPSKQIVWSSGSLRGPDDAFFTPGYRSIITNEEFNDTLTELSLASKRRVWRYGHDAVPGSGAGFLNTPDDAYRLANGTTTAADIRNCRIVLLSHSRRLIRTIGGSCVHDPPRGFASPNGDTPLAGGGLLVTEIGGWIDRLDARGNLVWSMRSPVAYPSDAQLLPDGRVLVASFTNPGKIVEVTPGGRVTWSFGASSGPDELAKPSLAVRLPNGLIAANDDYNQRVIVIDPRTKRIVWQYGHTGVAGSARGYLNKPDGLDLLPSATVERTLSVPARRRPALSVARIGSLPRPASRVAAVALGDGRVLALGGLVGGTSSRQVLLGRPERLAAVGSLPVPTHDDAAVLVRGAAYLYGGGQAVSSPAVVRIDPRTGAARSAGRLDEPLSDLGAATIGQSAYLVGGYTGSRYATAVLRVRGARSTIVARLPAGLRYAGVAALGGKLYVAGGVTTGGESAAIQVVDPASGTVTQLGALPHALAHAPLAAAGGALYLVGGTTSSGIATRQILHIDPETGVVRRAGRLPRPLADAAAVTVGDRVVVLGGSGTTTSAAVYAFHRESAK